MQEAHLLAPDIDLSAEYITTIWRANDVTLSENVATSVATYPANVATNVAIYPANVATELLAENKRIVDSMVAGKVKAKMSLQHFRECIIEVCNIEHSLQITIRDSFAASRRVVPSNCWHV
jgi:hypothetical protein